MKQSSSPVLLGTSEKEGGGDKVQSQGHVLKEPLLSTSKILVTFQSPLRDLSVDELKSSSLNRGAPRTMPLAHGYLLAILGQNHDLAPVHKAAGLRLHSFACRV